MKLERKKLLETKLRKIIQRVIIEINTASTIKQNKKEFYRDINRLCNKLMKEKNIKSWQHTGLDYVSWNRNKFFFTILSADEDVSKEIAIEIGSRVKRALPNTVATYKRFREWRQIDWSAAWPNPEQPEFGWTLIITFDDLSALETYEPGSVG